MKKLLSLLLLMSFSAVAMENSWKLDSSAEVISYTVSREKQLAFLQLKKVPIQLDSSNAQMIEDTIQAEQDIENYLQQVKNQSRSNCPKLMRPWYSASVFYF